MNIAKIFRQKINLKELANEWGHNTLGTGIKVGLELAKGQRL
jgi:hypothetical protein